MTVTAMTNGDDDGNSMTPVEAAEEYLAMRAIDLTESTLATYRRRLRSFIAWCYEVGIESMDELTPRLLRQYGLYERQQSNAPITVKNRTGTVRTFIEYFEGDVVPEGLSDHVDVPTVETSDQTDDTMVEVAQAKALLQYYRENNYGSRPHALLTVLWHVGCRRRAVRALDLGHFHPHGSGTEEGPDGPYLEFHHRPKLGLTLKNKEDSERAVGLAAWAADVLQTYVAEYRNDIRDEHGLEPLFTSLNGRPREQTITQWTYNATIPCIYGPCPHGNEPETCEYTQHNRTSGCPSSRSPHQFRTGTITDMCNRRIPIEAIANRVDAKPETIKRFYDKATKFDEMARRQDYFTDEEEP